MNRKGFAFKNIKLFKFIRDGLDRPILQGSSLKGMIRSVYEAITDSCLTLATTSRESRKSIRQYAYKDIGEYRNRECKDINRLCPACRLFGTIEGDAVNCQGRVIFSDASLTGGNLVQGLCFLRELSSPKPHHYATYASGRERQQGSPIAGRKFYYHHATNSRFFVEQCESDRSIAVEEYAAAGNEFYFEVSVENISEEELGKLLLAMELCEGLGHKIGIGKARGLGSCTIRIDKEKCFLVRAKDWYGLWKTPVGSDWYSLKADRSVLHGALVEVLRLNKAESGTIEYPQGDDYPREPIDVYGVFGGNAKVLDTPGKPVEIASNPIDAPPAGLKGDQTAAWLKRSDGDNLIFMDIEGREIIRPLRGYQGKGKLLQCGKWFILSGTIRVDPANRK